MDGFVKRNDSHGAVELALEPRFIERVKRSTVAVGTYLATRSPPFLFRGTGFAVGDGTLVATNAHVLPDSTQDATTKEALAIVLPSDQADASGRTATVASVDHERDLALLRIAGRPLPALALGDSDKVREGDSLLVTGFPLGTILGAYPVTHRVMVAANSLNAGASTRLRTP